MKAYVIFTGAPLTRGDILRKIAPYSAVTSKNGRDYLDLQGSATEIFGLPSTEKDDSDMISLRINYPIQAYSSIIEKLAVMLDWHVEIRPGVLRENLLIPPRLGELLERKISPSGQSPNAFLNGPTLFFKVATPLVTIYVASQVHLATRWIVALVAFTIALSISNLLFMGLMVLRSTPQGVFGAKDHEWLECPQIALLLVCGFTSLFQPGDYWIVGVISLAFILAGLWMYRRGRSASRLLSTQARLTVFRNIVPEDFASIEDDCLVCGYSLQGIDSCRCPECGIMNYYLVDRSDATHLALKHGAVMSHGRERSAS